MVAKVINKMNMNVYRRLFLKCSGLDPSDFETKLHPEKLDRILLIYRDPVTNERMRTPGGKLFSRYRIFKHKDGIKYCTCKNGGIHLYFPSCRVRGNIIDYLKANPDAPVYITEGEKKAAKAWLEGIPCIGIPGIWCWLANKEDRSYDNLENLPNSDRIKAVSKKVSSQFVNKYKYADSRLIAKQRLINHNYNEMTEEEKRALVEMVFSGKTPEGKRMGVYIRWDEKKKWRFNIHGHLIEETGLLPLSERQRKIFFDFEMDGGGYKQKELVTKSTLYYKAQSPP